MATPPRTRIAVIGAGLIGPRHARTVMDNPSAQLVAIVDPTQSGVDLAKTLNVSYYPSVSSLLVSPDKPDGAIICTPNHTHVPLGLELVKGGVHILVEKPVSTDITSGRELVRVAAEVDVKILVGHHRRFNSFMLAAKRVVDNGGIGEPVAINGIWVTYKPDEYFDAPGEWRRSVTGGVVLINLVHEVDLLQYLLGPIVRVYAEPIPSRRGFEAEEGAALTFRFASGAVGSFLLSDNVPSPHNFEAGTGENPLIPRTGSDFYRIFGTSGTLSVPELTISSYGGGVKSWTEVMKVERVEVDVKTPFEVQLGHFVGVCRGVESPRCSGEEGLAALVVCEAVKESLRSGMPFVVGGGGCS